MNNLNNIELTQRNIAGKNEVVPPDFIWDNIEKALVQKKKKRYFLLFWTSGISILLLAFITYSLRRLENNKQQKTTKIPIIGDNNSKENANVKIASNEEISYIIVKSNNFEINQKISKEDINKKSLYAFMSNEADVPLSDYDDKTILTKSENRDLLLFDALKSKMKYCINEDWKPKKRRHSKKDEVLCPDFRNRKRPLFFVEGGASLGLPIKTFDNNTSSISLLNLRKKTENEWYSWGVNAEIGLYLTKNFYAGAGISFNQLKERFILEKDAITKMVVNFDPVSGAPVDTSFVTGTFLNIGEIRYDILDIPLFAGYEKKNGKWVFGVEGELNININFSASGKIFNQNLKLSKVEDNSGIYKNNIGLAIKGTLFAGYFISPSLSLRLKPYFRYQLNPINSLDYPIDTRLNNCGINLALRKEF